MRPHPLESGSFLGSSSDDDVVCKREIIYRTKVAHYNIRSVPRRPQSRGPRSTHARPLDLEPAAPSACDAVRGQTVHPLEAGSLGVSGTVANQGATISKCVL